MSVAHELPVPESTVQARSPLRVVEPPRTGTADVPTPRGRTHEKSFAELAPVFRRMSELRVDDVRRDGFREQLIVGHLALATYVAARYKQPHTPQADLVQVATVGLIHAVDRFDPALGNSFLSFAVPTMTGEVRRYFRDHSWTLRMPRRLQELHRHVARARDELVASLGRSPRPSEIAEHLGVDVEEVRDGIAAGEAVRPRSIDYPLGDDGDETLADVLGATDDDLAAVEDMASVRPLLRELNPLERRVLQLRFVEEKSQTEIAADIGYSQMHVSRTLRRVLSRLRRRLDVDDPVDGSDASGASVPVQPVG